MHKIFLSMIFRRCILICVPISLFTSGAHATLYYVGTEPTKSNPTISSSQRSGGPLSTSTGLYYSDDQTASSALEYAIERIETVRSLTLSTPTAPRAAEESCLDCRISKNETPRNPHFQQCDSSNDYLENKLAALKQGSSLASELMAQSTEQNAIINPSCIRMGMESKFGPRSKSFARCDRGFGQAVRNSALRPCISENYFNLVSNSFNLVSRCMKDYLRDSDLESQKSDVEAVYSLINIESGFHINAMSPTGAGGIGQFTEGAIQTVNDNHFQKMRKHLQNSSDSQCQKIANEVLNNPMKQKFANSCERVSLEAGNPLKNMLYTYGYLKTSRSSMLTTVINHPSYSQKFALSRTELAKIERALMVWSHNAGPAGTWTPAKALLNSTYKNNKVTDADKFISEMERAMRLFPASANRGSARRNETATYYPKITSHLNNIKNSMESQTCVQ